MKKHLSLPKIIDEEASLIAKDPSHELQAWN
jgi:hypothetical protein